MDKSIFEECYNTTHREHMEKERQITRDLELHFFFKNVLLCFSKQFPDYHDTISGILINLPMIDVQSWAEMLAKEFAEVVNTTLEDAYQTVIKRFVGNVNKKNIPNYYGPYTHHNIISMEVRSPRRYNGRTMLMEASAPLDYSFIEGLALMVRGLYYDTPGASVYITNFTGK